MSTSRYRSVRDYLNGPLPPDSAVWGEPLPDIADRVALARRRGVLRCICGFLPDEVAWPQRGHEDDFAWFLDHLEFRPHVLDIEMAGGSTKRASHILLVRDERGAGAVDAAEALVQACASSVSLDCVAVEVEEEADAELAAAVAESALVVNHVQDWLMGFAIDELASRIGRPIMRLRNPGYSLLRYGLLDVSLPFCGADEPLHLRPWLVRLWAAQEARGRMANGWFHGPEAPARWRELMSRRAMVEYWGEDNLTALGSHPVCAMGSWLLRPLSWAALSAAHTSGSYPREAWDSAAAAMAAWLAASQGRREWRSDADVALVRWVRKHSAWLSVYRREAGDTRDARRSILRWIMGEVGADHESPTPDLLRVAHDQLGRDSPEARGLAVAAAWRNDWPAVQALITDAAIRDAEFRSLCAAMCWSRCAELAAAAEVAGDGATGWANSLAAAALWDDCLGAAGQVLRAIAAFILGERSLARRVWRSAHRAAGFPAGAYAGRVVRAIAQDGSIMRRWLRALARHDPADLHKGVPDLLVLWFRVRLPDLWRCNVPQDAARELVQVIEVVRARARHKPASARDRRMLLICLALAGRTQATLDAMGALGAGDCEVRAVAGQVAMALWMRGELPAAQEVLETIDDHPGDPAQALFSRAVAWQIMGNLERASQALERLINVAPEYLQSSAGDTRWAWAALVYHRAGKTAEAIRLRTIAQRSFPGSERAFIDVEVHQLPLAEGWRRLTGTNEG